jgi:hypothetical protein
MAFPGSVLSNMHRKEYVSTIRGVEAVHEVTTESMRALLIPAPDSRRHTAAW